MQPHANVPADDPRQARAFAGRVLQPRASYARERRLVLCHATAKSQMILACATDHDLETVCPHAYKVVHTEDFGQVAFTIEAQPGAPIHLTKYMVYHTSPTASPEEVCGRAEWTMDRVMQQGFQPLLAAQEQYLEDFWRRSDVRIRNIDSTRFQRSTVEIQQAIRFNLFHIVQASARADNAGVPAKGLTGQAYEGHSFWDTEIYLLPFLIYTSPRIARNLLTFRYQMLPQARARARELGHRGAMFPWRTINGEEASASYAAGTAQYHINADIMYALRKYVQATGDEPFLQDDSFLDREPWDFQHTPPNRYPLLLFYHPLDIYRKQVIKQADVVLAMFLLGNAFSLEEKQRNFAFYDPLTTGDSSLSSCIEAIIAAQVGDIEKATQYGMAALLMDLADVGGNVRDGCHIASMGGTWMMLAYGFGGLRDDDGTLSFWPRRPPEVQAILRFPLTYRGQRLEVELGPETVTYRLCEGERLVIRHEQENIQLTREQPLVIRPVSRW